MASDIGCHMVASDLLSWIPKILEDPTSHLKVQKNSGKSN